MRRSGCEIGGPVEANLPPRDSSPLLDFSRELRTAQHLRRENGGLGLILGCPDFEPRTISVNRVRIRLTDERWTHIVNANDDLAGYCDDCLQAIEDPDLILSGRRGSLKAVKGYGRGRFLVVIYRDLSPDDGFVVTAYFVRRIDRRKTVWRR
jgi:hypothetical protein